MELKAKDRIVLLQIIPKEGDFLTFKAIRALQDELHFADEEVAALSMKQTDEGMLTWDALADAPHEFTFNKSQRDVIEKALVDLNSKGKINADSYDLYEKFVGE